MLIPKITPTTNNVTLLRVSTPRTSATVHPPLKAANGRRARVILHSCAGVVKDKCERVGMQEKWF